MSKPAPKDPPSMPTAIQVPALGESINEAIVARWLKQVGDPVVVDEPIVELETDKITVEVPAPIAGVLIEHQAAEGDRVQVGDVVAKVDNAGVSAGTIRSKSPESAKSGNNGSPTPAVSTLSNGATPAMPAAEAEAGRLGVNLADLSAGSGRGGRLLKEDVQAAAHARAGSPTDPSQPLSPAQRGSGPANESSSSSGGGAVQLRSLPSPEESGRPPRERRVAMTTLRKRIAERLVASQQNAAILTTFNEVDMSAVMEVRKRYKDRFVDRHGVKLGFMSFFVKAATEALQSIPAVNAEIQGEEIIYKEYYDIGVAVGGGRGLVVPVIRSADQLGFAAIEREIGRLAGLAKTNKLQISDLTGGTFTISNGGIYGSMLSTPILNPPQTGILGLHNIVERPIAVAGKVEIRPIMYLALSYDHRLVDGREAVQFLVQIKACIEDPYRMMLEV